MYVFVTRACTRVTFEIYKHIIVGVTAARRASYEVAISTNGRHENICAIIVDPLNTTVSKLSDT